MDRTLAETGTEPQALVLEIIETILIDDIEVSVALLRSLYDRGVRGRPSISAPDSHSFAIYHVCPSTL